MARVESYINARFPAAPQSSNQCWNRIKFLQCQTFKPWLDAGCEGTHWLLVGMEIIYISRLHVYQYVYNQCVAGVMTNTRVVVRHCTIENTQMLTHGTTSLQRAGGWGVMQ